MARQPDNSAMAVVIAIIAHALVIAALTFSLPLQTRQRGQVVVPIEAVLDMEQLARERQRLEQEAAERERLQREAAEAERERQAEAEREQREAEQRRQAEVERQRVAEAEAERQRQAEQQRQREAEAEAERQRQAELQRQREAEEAERQRQAALERERQLQREQAEREADLQRLLQAEERARLARASGAEDEYRRSIQNKIQQHWIRPASAGPGIECVVTVEQIRSGDVTNVVVGRCNGDDAVVSSIERAVLAASPLPRPPVPEVFQRTLVITFKPDDAL